METKRKIIVILGPTSSGKSDLAVEIAKKIDGEIISADSRQIYKNLDIGSGKISKKEMRGIPHHLLDVVSPRSIFTVVDFKERAEKSIKDVLSRDKVPIICGGTGFYIQAIVDNIVIPEVKANWNLRKKLEKKTTEQLFKMLQKLDPRRSKNIDSKNPRRLVRAIEIAKALGKVPKQKSGLSADKAGFDYKEAGLHGFQFLQIGIKLDEQKLKLKIEKRVKNMIKQGLIKETEKLHNPPAGRGLSWKRIYELGFEYKYPAMFLRKQITKKEAVERMVIENIKYAKRQMTWFSAKGGPASGGKKDKRIKWIKNPKEALKLAKKFLSSD